MRASRAMAAYLADADVRPELILCSAGLRARQTMAAVLPSLGGALEVRVRPDLYTFDSDVLRRHLQGLPDDRSAVMLVGHNPALHELALTLCGRGQGLDRLRAKLPTGALVGIRVPGSWRELGAVRGELVSFVTPRDLEGTDRDG